MKLNLIQTRGRPINSIKPGLCITNKTLQAWHWKNCKLQLAQYNFGSGKTQLLCLKSFPLLLSFYFNVTDTQQFTVQSAVKWDFEHISCISTQSTRNFLQSIVVCISTAVPVNIRQISPLTYEKAMAVFTCNLCVWLYTIQFFPL